MLHTFSAQSPAQGRCTPETPPKQQQQEACWRDGAEGSLCLPGSLPATLPEGLVVWLQSPYCSPCRWWTSTESEPKPRECLTASPWGPANQGAHDAIPSKAECCCASPSMLPASQHNSGRDARASITHLPPDVLSYATPTFWPGMRAKHPTSANECAFHLQLHTTLHVRLFLKAEDPCVCRPTGRSDRGP
jgi:hypothetical protein